jgi:protein gp37
MAKSKIEWTESTWNPVTGCTKISPGCLNCYAEKMANRLKLMGQPNYINGFKITMHENTLNVPFKLRKPQTIFVNSMSDLFHDEIPFEYIKKVFEVMNNASQHIFQVLTKRSKRLVELSSELNWTPNIWMGVSVENEDYLHRIDHLRKINATIKFISFEPLIGYIKEMNLENIDWVIVGGESGYGARPIKEDWVKEIRNLSVEMDIPFFFKQWGGFNKKKAGRLLEGVLWEQIPDNKSITYNLPLEFA